VRKADQNAGALAEVSKVRHFMGRGGGSRSGQKRKGKTCWDQRKKIAAIIEQLEKMDDEN